MTYRDPTALRVHHSRLGQLPDTLRAALLQPPASPMSLAFADRARGTLSLLLVGVVLLIASAIVFGTHLSEPAGLDSLYVLLPAGVAIIAFVVVRGKRALTLKLEFQARLVPPCWLLCTTGVGENVEAIPLALVRSIRKNSDRLEIVLDGGEPMRRYPLAPDTAADPFLERAREAQAAAQIPTLDEWRGRTMPYPSRAAGVLLPMVVGSLVGGALVVAAVHVATLRASDATRPRWLGPPPTITRRPNACETLEGRVPPGGAMISSIDSNGVALGIQLAASGRFAWSESPAPDPSNPEYEEHRDGIGCLPPQVVRDWLQRLQSLPGSPPPPLVPVRPREAGCDVALMPDVENDSFIWRWDHRSVVFHGTTYCSVTAEARSVTDPVFEMVRRDVHATASRDADADVPVRMHFSRWVFREHGGSSRFDEDVEILRNGEWQCWGKGTSRGEILPSDIPRVADWLVAATAFDDRSEDILSWDSMSVHLTAHGRTVDRNGRDALQVLRAWYQIANQFSSMCAPPELTPRGWNPPGR